VTARRQVPLTGDTLAWVHSELAEIKSRLAVVQQAVEQSRGLASDAAEKASSLRSKVEQAESHGAAIVHLQEELRLVRDQLARSHDDINSLRQSREEGERRDLADSERQRKELNDLTRRLAETQRQVETALERMAGIEEHGRRNLELASQLALKIDALETEREAAETRNTRLQTTLSRMDQEVTRLNAAIPDLHRENEARKEREESITEMLRRLESELDAMRTKVGQISRIDDRLELVQAERSRHGERLNELTSEVDLLKTGLDAQAERSALVDARIAGYQDEVRALHQKLLAFRDELGRYMHSAAGQESDFRKRQMAALEKEIRDLRSRALNFPDE